MHPTHQTCHVAIDARFAAGRTRAPNIEDEIRQCRALAERIPADRSRAIVFADHSSAVGNTEGPSFAAMMVAKLQNVSVRARGAAVLLLTLEER